MSKKLKHALFVLGGAAVWYATFICYAVSEFTEAEDDFIYILALVIAAIYMWAWGYFVGRIK